MEWGKGIPIPTTWRIWDLDVEPIVLFPFRELIGALLWIALLSRPDIVNAVRAVARYYCSAPKMVHWKATFDSFGYAVRTSSFGITFRRGPV